MEYYSQMLAAVPLERLAVSALIMFVISSLWVSPLLFERSLIRHSGIRRTDYRPHERRVMFIVRALLCVFCAYLIGLFAMQVGTHHHALIVSVVLMWSFVMIEQLSSTLRRREPIALFFLLTFRSLACLTAGALVYYVWNLV